MDKEVFFKNQQKELREALIKVRKLENRLSLWRSLVFVLAVLALAAGYDGYAAGWAAGLALLAAFVLLVRGHGRIRQELAVLEQRLQATADFLCRMEGGWRELPVNGEIFLQEERPQGRDLHLFGRASLFQYLCLARTRGGRERLSDVLSPFPASREVILMRQEAVAELAKEPEVVLELTGLLQAVPEEHDLTTLTEKIRGAGEAGALPYLILGKLRYVLPLLPWLALVGAFLGRLPWEAPCYLWLFNLALSIWAAGAHGEILAPLLEIRQALRGYEGLFAWLESREPRSLYLADLRRHFLGETEGKGRGVKASAGLTQLAGLSERFLYRQNILAFVLLNALFLMDSHLAAGFLKWQKVAGAQLSGWMSALQEMEMLVSLSVPALTREKTVLPVLLAEKAPIFKAEEAVSLLLEEEKAVGNDADFGGESVIITGSNMSGKTTYLRTLGTLAILAYAGAVVPARRLELSLMDIYTSIQVSDDLSKGISTFYAELLRVRQMVEGAELSRPMLCLIDEIFKGTNSADRIVGARAAITRLTRPNILTIVTTHDFELCDLKGPKGQQLRNFHFEEHYTEDRIEFDFRIKEGRCRTTNARYLLKMAGIID